MLMFWLTHVVATFLHPENIDNLCRSLRFGAIANQAIHGSPFSNILLKDPCELCIGFATINIGYIRLVTDENLGHRLSIIDSWLICPDCICRHQFISTPHFLCWKAWFQVGTKWKANDVSSILHGLSKHLLYYFDRSKPKQACTFSISGSIRLVSCLFASKYF